MMHIKCAFAPIFRAHATVQARYKIKTAKKKAPAAINNKLISETVVERCAHRAISVKMMNKKTKKNETEKKTQIFPQKTVHH